VQVAHGGEAAGLGKNTEALCGGGQAARQDERDNKTERNRIKMVHIPHSAKSGGRNLSANSKIFPGVFHRLSRKNCAPADIALVTT
jgi:hypothetical protein